MSASRAPGSPRWHALTSAGSTSIREIRPPVDRTVTKKTTSVACNQGSSRWSNCGERRAVRREGGTKMYAFVVFVGLALALAVVGQVLDEVLPVKFPKALTTTMTVAIAILGAWAIDYSVFESFGQALRADWQNPVVTGIVLVGAGEFLRA